MSNLHVKYLLVGGGVASAAAAEAIRGIDVDGSILLVTQEINRPYHRPPLSKEYLRREKPRTELFVHPADWFERHHIELRTARNVTRVEPARESATLDNGEEISFDKLLLATGASPKVLQVPGAELPNTFYLRTMEDANRLHKAVEKARGEGRLHGHGQGRGRIAVIGGGLLGVELADSFTRVGLAVDLIVADAYPWYRFAGPLLGRALALFLERQGVRLHLDCQPRTMEGDGRVQRIVLTNGTTVDCDFSVVAIGAVVNKGLLRGTTIAAENAILVDDHCRTSEASIYAAGDCAAIFDPLFKKHRIIDHWENAVITGGIAGRNMAGADEAYHAVSSYSSKPFGLHLHAWGEPRLVDRRLIRGPAGPAQSLPELVEIGVAADGRVAQVLAVGHGAEEDALRELVARRFAVDGFEEALKDPQTPLTKLLLDSPPS